MNSRVYKHIQNHLFPCLFFSILTGLFAAVIVSAFKLAAEWTIHLSTSLYDAARSAPVFLPLLILGAAILGFMASIILSFTHSCRGGGIPTSIAAIRGIISFNWLASVIALPISALLTFLSGVPLGTEGPCVQMGTAIGDGVISCFGSKKHRAWRRYAMTGGASAGFSIATSSPITAILFSFEELNKHFSPMLLTFASLSVLTAQAVAHFLASLGFGSIGFFHLSRIDALPLKMIFAPIIVGLICGLCSIFFNRFYHFVNKIMKYLLKKVSVKIMFPILFASIALIGFFMAEVLSSGHSLVDTLFDVRMAWYLLILIFLVRALLMTVSNTSGVTGGVFLPTIAFGAIIGSLCAEIMISLSWIAPDHRILMIVLGITAFLGSTSRIPLTASVFAVEALGGINNILAIVIAATVAVLVVEVSGTEDFTDTVIEAKVHSITKGKKPTVIEVSLRVMQNSFVVGKELHNLLWPHSCVVVSYERANKDSHEFGIAEGDVITVHYTTYHPEETAKELRALVGKQPEEIYNVMIDPT